MDYINFNVEQQDGIATIIFDRSDIRNCIEAPGFQLELNEILDWLNGQDEVRVLVLRNTGKHFSAGGNVKKMYRNLIEGNEGSLSIRFRERVKLMGDLVNRIETMPKPIIASVNGAAAGGGANLALACDFVIASTRTSFYQSFANINFIPDSGGLRVLANAVGLRKAKELAMTTDPVSAEEAEKMGMITQAVPEENLVEATMQLAEKLAAKPPQAIASIKRMCSLLPDLSRSAYLEMEADSMGVLYESKDTLKAITAFVSR